MLRVNSKTPNFWSNSEPVAPRKFFLTGVGIVEEHRYTDTRSDRGEWGGRSRGSPSKYTFTSIVG